MKKIFNVLLVMIVLSSLVSCAGSRRLGCPSGMAGQEPRGRYRASIEGKNVIIDESKYFANRNDSDPKIGDSLMVAFNTAGNVVAYGTTEGLSDSVVWKKVLLEEPIREQK
jgi:hypothetical protein